MQRLGAPVHPGAWRGFRGYTPLLHAPVAAAWSFGVRPEYVAAADRPTLADHGAAAAGMQALVRRYLAGFGPATVADVAQSALVRRARAKGAPAALAGDLERREGPNGEGLFDVPGEPLPDEDTPAPPRLMAMWDSVLLACADRARIIPPEYRRIVIRSNGDVLPTLLVVGHVAGVWRPVDGGIEATARHPLPNAAWEGLSAEARSLMALLADREPGVYSRHGYWWDKLSGAEVRLLPGVRSPAGPALKERAENERHREGRDERSDRQGATASFPRRPGPLGPGRGWMRAPIPQRRAPTGPNRVRPDWSASIGAGADRNGG